MLHLLSTTMTMLFCIFLGIYCHYANALTASELSKFSVSGTHQATVSIDTDSYADRWETRNTIALVKTCEIPYQASIPRNVWYNPWESSMVNTGILLNNMKSPLPNITRQCILEHWNDPLTITLVCDIVIELDLITEFGLLSKFREVSIEH